MWERNLDIFILQTMKFKKIIWITIFFNVLMISTLLKGIPTTTCFHWGYSCNQFKVFGFRLLLTIIPMVFDRLFHKIMNLFALATWNPSYYIDFFALMQPRSNQLIFVLSVMLSDRCAYAKLILFLCFKALIELLQFSLLVHFIHSSLTWSSSTSLLLMLMIISN